MIGLVGAFVPSTALAAPSPSGPASTYQPVGPIRVADTRQLDCGCTHIDGSTIHVQIAGRVVDGISVPASIVAAAITITASNPSAAAFVTASPSSSARPETSTVNVRSGVDIANSTIVAVGPDGAIDLFAQAPMDLIVDLSGVFVEATSATAGRFQPLAPARLLDTRSPDGELPMGTVVTVPLPVGVASDAVALAVNITSVDAAHTGYLSAFPAGTDPPSTSIINPDGSGSPMAATVIVPVTPAGLSVLTQAGGHVLVDVVGWFTGPSAPSSADGLFVPTTPTRMLDTRSSRPRLWSGGTREVAAPVAAAALVTNLTVDTADGPGYVTAFPAGTGLPNTSSLNAARRDTTVANMAITVQSTRGVAYYSSRGTDLLVDLTGWFTGAPVAATAPVPANTPPSPRVLLLGDSTLAALNVSTSSQRALLGFQPVLDAEPCRRLVRPSCKSDFTLRVPNTGVQAINTTPGAIDGLVVKAGYNDSSTGFEDVVAQIMAAARAKGATFVIWLTYSEGHTSSQAVTYQRNNATLQRLAGSAAYPDLFVADWRTYAAPSTGWYASDRLHLGTAGAWATADYISRWVAAVERLPCPKAWAPGGAILDPCPSPDAVAAATGTLPNVKALYGY